ncbi:MAG: hypothetical protein AAFY76_12850, partial [Cyanobacteria bacterium J06649_11]
NIYRYLRPGGVFIFSDGFLRGSKIEYEHVVWRTRDEIESALRMANFQSKKRQPMFMLMNQPIDSDNKILKTYWKLLKRLLGRLNALGNILGPFLYPFELLLISCSKESPSTEILICQKPK